MMARVKGTPNRKKGEYYIEPEEFRQLIIKFYDTGVFSEELGVMVLRLAKGIGNNTSFINYTFKDEMVDESILKITSVLNRKKYDPYKGNAYSYFTTVGGNTFKNYLKQFDKKQQMITDYQTSVYGEMINADIIDVNANEGEVDVW